MTEGEGWKMKGERCVERDEGILDAGTNRTPESVSPNAAPCDQ